MCFAKTEGIVYVTIEEKEMTQYEFIKTPTRPFLQIEVHITDDDQTAQLIQEIQRHDLTNAIVKVLYHLPSNTKDRVDLAKVQKACSNAWYVVAIIPVRTLETRERRAALKVDMPVEHLLSMYFDTKPAYKTSKQALIEKALELNNQID